MKREDISIAVIFFIAVAVLLWATYETLQLIKELGPALIAGAVTLMAAVLTHTLAQLREQRQQQQELKQSNYSELLEVAAKYVRKPSDNRDNLDKAHMLSWVVGSKEVIKATQEFTEEQDDVALRKLLEAMRQDIGLSKVPNALEPNVFPPQEAPGSLKKRSTKPIAAPKR